MTTPATKKPLTLLLMAAGLGSRYGGIKQIDGFGPNGETIIDYSLYDALRCGFSKVVFVVRDEIHDAVHDLFMPKLAGRAEVRIVSQRIDSELPEQYKPLLASRTKPWGTAHALLCAKDIIHEPFAAINADDFYGLGAFQALADFFQHNHHDHTMVGYALNDVLSANGTVSRGVATVSNHELQVLDEQTKIARTASGIRNLANEQSATLPDTTVVSMNCWGFRPSIFAQASAQWRSFLEAHGNSASAEFYIATLVTALIQQQAAKIQVIPGGDTWFGVTYKEDKPLAQAQIREQVKLGNYPLHLWR